MRFPPDKDIQIADKHTPLKQQLAKGVPWVSTKLGKTRAAAETSGLMSDI